MDLIKHTLIFLFVTIPLQLVGIVVLPIVLLFIPKDRETLPAFVRWFDNAEIPLGIGSKDDGLAGPAYYRDEAIATYKKFVRSDYLALYICRYVWLAFRNPINYFQYKVIGFQVPKAGIKVIQPGDPFVGNKQGEHAGTSSLVIEANGKQYRDYYKVIKLGKTRCLRIRIGYKIGTVAERKPGDYRQFVYTFNLAAYEGV